jgi:hypothetical protein
MATPGTAIALVPMPAPMGAIVARPLYDIEQHLASLVDCEGLVPEELETEYALELQATMLAAVEKRDRVGQFLAHLESQITLAEAEGKRLAARKDLYQRALDRMEGYVSRVIESLGKDAAGKRKRLEGKTVTLALHGCDKRAEVTDEAAVPTKYKRVTITLPAETWELVCDSLDFQLREQVLSEVRSPKVEVATSLVKADLKAGVEVTGAVLAGGTYLVRR